MDDLKLPGMLFGDFVRSAHARNRLMRVSKAALPGVEAVLTAAELKPLNLHYMPTLAGDVQAALADEKVLFQNQHVTCVVANDRYVVYRPRLVGHRAGACAAGAAGESRSRLTAAGGLGPCRPTSRVASQAAREAGSARRGSPTVARLRAHEGPSSGVRTRRPARPFPSGARAKAGGLATPEERGPFRKSRAVDRLPWPWRAAGDVLREAAEVPPHPLAERPEGPEAARLEGGADADAPGRAVADGDEHGRPALAGGRGGRAGAPPRVDRPGDGGAAAAAGAARRAGARGGGRAVPARRPRRPAPGGAGAAAARSRPHLAAAPAAEPAGGRHRPREPGVRHRPGRPRPPRGGRARRPAAAVDGRARDAPDAAGRGGPVRPADRG